MINLLKLFFMGVFVLHFIATTFTSADFENYTLLPANSPHCRNKTISNLILFRQVHLKTGRYDRSVNAIKYVCNVTLEPMGRLMQMPYNTASFWLNRFRIYANFSNCNDRLLIHMIYMDRMYTELNSHSRTLEYSCGQKYPIIETAKENERRMSIAWLTKDGSYNTGSSIIIQINTFMLFNGNFSLNEKRNSCHMTGYWCGNETAVCIHERLRCDGVNDCFDSFNGTDELNCPLTNNNVSNVVSPPFHDHDKSNWTSLLLWIALGSLPLILLFALARICSQKRQLDLSEDDYKLPCRPETDDLDGDEECESVDAQLDVGVEEKEADEEEEEEEDEEEEEVENNRVECSSCSSVRSETKESDSSQCDNCSAGNKRSLNNSGRQQRVSFLTETNSPFELSSPPPAYHQVVMVDINQRTTATAAAVPSTTTPATSEDIEMQCLLPKSSSSVGGNGNGSNGTTQVQINSRALLNSNGTPNNNAHPRQVDRHLSHNSDYKDQYYEDPDANVPNGNDSAMSKVSKISKPPPGPSASSTSGVRHVDVSTPLSPPPVLNPPDFNVPVNPGPGPSPLPAPPPPPPPPPFPPSTTLSSSQTSTPQVQILSPSSSSASTSYPANPTATTTATTHSRQDSSPELDNFAYTPLLLHKQSPRDPVICTDRLPRSNSIKSSSTPLSSSLLSVTASLGGTGNSTVLPTTTQLSRPSDKSHSVVHDSPLTIPPSLVSPQSSDEPGEYDKDYIVV